MKNVKQQLHSMYVGLVFTYWSKEGTSLGTAKQKALQQMQSFSKTIDKKNPVAQQIAQNVNEMTRNVSKQIMTDRSSNIVLDKKQAPQYEAFGKRQVEQSKKTLNDIVKRAEKFAPKHLSREYVDMKEKATAFQDMMKKKNASQYRATNTNEAASQMDKARNQNQQVIIQFAIRQKMLENAA